MEKKIIMKMERIHLRSRWYHVFNDMHNASTSQTQTLNYYYPVHKAKLSSPFKEVNPTRENAKWKLVGSKKRRKKYIIKW